ncbi:MAG: hypothetical protein V4764_25945 [Burkholderia sp.]
MTLIAGGVKRPDSPPPCPPGNGAGRHDTSLPPRRVATYRFVSLSQLLRIPNQNEMDAPATIHENRVASIGTFAIIACPPSWPKDCERDCRIAASNR